MKDDGSFRAKGKTSPLQRILLERRSHRKYAKGEASPEHVEHIKQCVEQIVSTVRLESARLEILGPGSEFEAVIRAAMKGLVGKVNPWLPLMNARHLLLCGAIYPEGADGPGIEAALVQGAMAMQMAVLAATEVGLATCWLAGINHAKIEEAYRMRDGATLIAISPLGFPAKRKGISWDALTFHLISKRRKPLDEIWMRDRWDEGGRS